MFELRLAGTTEIDPGDFSLRRPRYCIFLVSPTIRFFLGVAPDTVFLRVVPDTVVFFCTFIDNLE